ncbi:hypothetical protein M5K25_005125 [Dendrobium thyrsiflorum]|uniref:Glycosyltransferase family 28 N-terminal domain-containing protein n=1 Tax=Dendrobium thyrsiflorum TaxID=117978 RepID=A0ABD0VGN6_DENTH
MNGEGSSSSPPVRSDRNLPRANTMPGGNKSEVAEIWSGPQNLERSSTEKRRQNNSRTDPTVQLFDDKISDKKKLKMLNRMATVKGDGTVEVEVPGDIESATLDFRLDYVVDGAVDEEPMEVTDLPYVPPLQIAILIVGTRGDVQPFIAIGKRLQDYGHRVRLATHANFKEFVLTAGLEFYPLGGDPKVLAEYMPARSQIWILVFRSKQKLLLQIHQLMVSANQWHTHVAEALKVPIHIFFTMPWTPTSEFPHHLSRVKQSAGYRLSYQIVDFMIWLGIRDMINQFRKKKLKLRPVTYLSGVQGSSSDIPHGYIWSPHLVPKPKDWGPKIDVVGFCFLDLASNYQPPESLVNWIEAGEKPIYIGFGSLPVQEPEKMTRTIVEALEITGQRGIINKVQDSSAS